MTLEVQEIPAFGYESFALVETKEVKEGESSLIQENLTVETPFMTVHYVFSIKQQKKHMITSEYLKIVEILEMNTFTSCQKMIRQLQHARVWQILK